DRPSNSTRVTAPSWPPRRSSRRRWRSPARPFVERSRRSSLRRGNRPLLANLGGLATPAAPVVKLRPANSAAGDHLDLFHDRAVHRERRLDAHAEAPLADGERLANAGAATRAHHAPEALDSGAVPLHRAHVDADGVTGLEVGDVGAQRGGVD